MAKVLLIDDDETYRTLTARALEQLGHEVETATNGAKAFRHLPGGFDLIVTDIFMPDMDGLEFIRTAVAMTAAPILAISGGGTRVQVDFLRHAGLLGAGAVLQKPFTPSELGAAVGPLLARKAATRADGLELVP